MRKCYTCDYLIRGRGVKGRICGNEELTEQDFLAVEKGLLVCPKYKNDHYRMLVIAEKHLSKSLREIY